MYHCLAGLIIHKIRAYIAVVHPESVDVSGRVRPDDTGVSCHNISGGRRSDSKKLPRDGKFDDDQLRANLHMRFDRTQKLYPVKPDLRNRGSVYEAILRVRRRDPSPS